MAHLLGSRYCIESLRNDVTDIQATVVDVFSRSGPVRFPSWKYPDKVSADVDMTELLELYDYTEDEEERQVAHIVLLEMVIDRFVLLLQSLTKHTESMGCNKTGTTPTGTESHMSIGLVVKKYWNKMLQTHTAVTSLLYENKKCTKKMSDLENQVKKLTEEVELLTDTIANMEEAAKSVTNCQTPFPLNDKDTAVVRALTSASNYTISKDEYNKATQTLETAFVPCESCDSVQKNLRGVGDLVVHVCAAQGLPSSLGKYKAQLDGLDWFTGNDVARWTVEQNKDLTRINKHLDTLLSKIAPLEEQLATTNKRNNQLEKKMATVASDMKLERETSSTERKQFKSRIEEIERDSKEKVEEIRKEKNDVERGRREFAKQIETLKTKLDEQKELLQQVESAKMQLENDLTSNQANHEQVHDLESTITTLTSSMDEVKVKLKSSNQELSKERARVKSLEKQTELIQGKHSGLVSRLEELSEECEELRGQVADMEEDKEGLEEKLDRTREEAAKAQEELKEGKSLIRDLQQDKEGLERSMVELKDDITALEGKLTEVHDREKLMIEYPDLNGPVNPDLTGTGDLALDMENQIKANSVRIQILEEQNNKLRRTVTKMMQRQRDNGEKQVAPKAVPLWSHPAEQNNYSNNSPSDHQLPPDTDYMAGEEQYIPERDTQHAHPLAKREQQFIQQLQQQQQQQQTQHVQPDFLVGRSTKSKGQQMRPGSGSKSSSVAAYAKLQKSGLLKGRPSSGKSSSGHMNNVHECSRCSKTYNNPKDLEIHKTYCY